MSVDVVVAAAGAKRRTSGAKFHCVGGREKHGTANRLVSSVGVIAIQLRPSSSNAWLEGGGRERVN